MAILERYARNKRSKEKSIVLTARLPESLYNDFKTMCDELGLSISEGVQLLVNHEVMDFKAKNELATTIENTVEVKENTSVPKPKTKRNTNSNTTPNTNVFKKSDYVVGKQIPCPICREWRASSNFARHALRVHNIPTVEQLITENLAIVNEMILERKSQEG